MILVLLGFLIICGFLSYLQAADQWKGIRNTSGVRDVGVQAEVRYILAVRLRQYQEAYVSSDEQEVGVGIGMATWLCS